MSTMTKGCCSLYHFLLLGLIVLGLGWSVPSHAIYSCDAAAGFIAGSASGESCGLNKYTAQASYNAAGDVILDGAAHTSLSSGAMGGHISILDSGLGSGTGEAQFYSNMLVDFYISGPASPVPVPVNLIFSFSGSVTADCSNCEADLNFSSQLQRQGFTLSAQAGRHLFNGVVSDWASSVVTSGLDSTGTISLFNPDTNVGSLTFDASTILGQTLRFTGSLGGNAHLLSPAGSIVITADNTSLFNILLPDGYTLHTLSSDPNTGFLSDPTLVSLPGVPLPTAAPLFVSGIVTFAGAAFARRRRIHP